MRITRGDAVRALLVAAVLAAAPAAPAQVLPPEESAAKARALIQQAIQALGGDAYLNVRDRSCTGRVAFYNSHGELAGFQPFFDFQIEPDKNRTEYSKKRNVIYVFNGDEGWVLDRGGVEPAPAESVERFQESRLKSADYLLRFRLNEEGLIFRYLGTDIIDLRRADWVEVVDRERRSIRIALDQRTRLPMRTVALVRDRATRQRVEEVEIYGNWQRFQGVQTPKQITRERNGRQIYQVFYTDCKLNPGLDPVMFTRDGLEQTWVRLGRK